MDIKRLQQLYEESQEKIYREQIDMKEIIRDNFDRDYKEKIYPYFETLASKGKRGALCSFYIDTEYCYIGLDRIYFKYLDYIYFLKEKKYKITRCGNDIEISWKWG